MMKCTDFRENMFSYLEGDLPEQQHKKMAEHLFTCLECKQEIQLWEQSEQWLHTEPIEFDLSSWSVAESVMARIRQEERWAYSITEQISLISRKMSIWLTGFATLFLFLLGYSFFTSLEYEKQVEERTFYVTTTIEHAIGTGEIGFADATISSNDSLSIAGMVASIGEPMMVSGTLGHQSHSVNIYLALSLYGLFIVLLTMSWITRNIRKE